MKIVIDNGGLVSDFIALQMVLKILDRPDGAVNFTHNLTVTIKTTKTQKSFTVGARA